MVVITKQFRIGLFPRDLGPFPQGKYIAFGKSTLLPGAFGPSSGKSTLLR